MKRCDASTEEAIDEAMEGHNGKLSVAVISDDMKLIVTGSKDGTIKQ